MVNGECVVRCAGDQDQSWHWLAYEVSYHLLRWDLLCQPEGPSVASGHTTSIHQLVHVLNDSGFSSFVAIGMGTSAVTLSFDKPGEAGNVVAELGQFYIFWLVLEHVIEECESTYFPVLLQAWILACVGDWDVHSHGRVVLVLALPGS